MNISKEQLRNLVLRILEELKQERKQKMYLLCMSSWSEEYAKFLAHMELSEVFDICPVIPLSWKKQGFEEQLRQYQSCSDILYRSWDYPADLDAAVTVFPVVPRDVIVKTALCISDTFETAWIAACISRGGRTLFLRSGLTKFSGKEQPAYVSRILDYYRQVFLYGIEIGCVDDLRKNTASGQMGPSVSEKKRVISSLNVEELAMGGILYLQPGDIITDLARDKAESRKIVIEKKMSSKQD